MLCMQILNKNVKFNFFELIGENKTKVKFQNFC